MTIMRKGSYWLQKATALKMLKKAFNIQKYDKNYFELFVNKTNESESRQKY